eukprot:3939786-Rhodomonas_salina.3
MRASEACWQFVGATPFTVCVGWTRKTCAGRNRVFVLTSRARCAANARRCVAIFTHPAWQALLCVFDVIENAVVGWAALQENHVPVRTPNGASQHRGYTADESKGDSAGRHGYR